MPHHVDMLGGTRVAYAQYFLIILTHRKTIKLFRYTVNFVNISLNAIFITVNCLNGPVFGLSDLFSIGFGIFMTEEH